MVKRCCKEDKTRFLWTKPLSPAPGLPSVTLETGSSYGHFQAARLNLLKGGRASPTVGTQSHPPKARRWTGQWREETGYFPEVCLKCSVYRMAFFLWEMKRKYKKRGQAFKCTLSTQATQLLKLFLLCNHWRQFLSQDEFRVLKLSFESAWFNTPHRFKRGQGGLKSYSLYLSFGEKQTPKWHTP